MKELEEFVLEEENVDPTRNYTDAFDQWRTEVTQDPGWRLFDSNDRYQGLPRRILIGASHTQERRVKVFILDRIRVHQLPYVYKRNFSEDKGPEEFSEDSQEYRQAS